MRMGAYLGGKGAATLDKFFLQKLFFFGGGKLVFIPFFYRVFPEKYVTFINSCIAQIMTNPMMCLTQNSQKWTFLVFSLFPSNIILHRIYL